MEIREVRSKVDAVFTKPKKDKSTVIGASSEGKQSFVEVVDDRDKEYRKREFEELIIDIDKSSKRFLARPGTEEFNEYKRLVKAFLEKVVSKGFEVIRSGMEEKSKKKGIYAVIIQIDQKIVELGEQVVKFQKPVLKLAAKVNEIRGLLADIYR